MRVKYFAWFDSKHEKTEFVNLLRECRSDMEAVSKVMERYPEINMSEAMGVVENFKKKINTKKS